MVNKHSRSSSGMRKESDLKRWGTTTLPETQSDRRVLHTGDPLVKLSPFFHKWLRGFSTRPRKPTKGRTADPGEKQHPWRRNPEIRQNVYVSVVVRACSCVYMCVLVCQFVCMHSCIHVRRYARARARVCMCLCVSVGEGCMGGCDCVCVRV